MALEEKEFKTYVSFKAGIGSLTVKSTEDDPKAKPRTYIDTQSGEEKTVYEKRFKSLTGIVAGIEVDTTGDYGTQVKLTIRDDEDYVFSVPLKTGWGPKNCWSITKSWFKRRSYIFSLWRFYIDRRKRSKSWSINEARRWKSTI